MTNFEYIINNITPKQLARFLIGNNIVIGLEDNVKYFQTTNGKRFLWENDAINEENNWLLDDYKGNMWILSSNM